MAPFLLKVPIALNQSFSIRTDVGICYRNEWHYHSEIEILYILKGNVSGRIGDTVYNIKTGDLFLLGSNLPHMIMAEEQDGQKDDFEAIVIHFSPAILSEFLSLPENRSLVALLKKESLSLDIKGNARSIVVDLIKALLFAVNTQRLIYLLQILQAVSESKHDCTPISSASFKSTHAHEEHRLNKVFNYTVEHYLHEISLKEIAEVIHMTPHSFCRYFKSRTNKTYSQLLIEMRVNHACKLLKETELSIAEVSINSGYMNFSNFNRHFKELVSKTPMEYRKSYNSFSKTPAS
ncbi:MAG: helix-turn-helix transcriptional regulator [Sphingobacteriaceae bacterium]|nr:helix-turn-helix transcriptional regulator [Sphingobacteriaceae bacterium]